jgi:pimeloyl-ACP methyl ester carboxylesterase
LLRVVTEALADDTRDDTEELVRGFERFWDVEFPADRRASWVDNDRRALEAAVTTAISEGPVASDLTGWETPCLIFIGAGDVDFREQATRAASEIPHAELLLLDKADHYGAHVAQDQVLIDAVLRTLRR